MRQGVDNKVCRAMVHAKLAGHDHCQVPLSFLLQASPAYFGVAVPCLWASITWPPSSRAHLRWSEKEQAWHWYCCLDKGRTIDVTGTCREFDRARRELRRCLSVFGVEVSK